MAETKPIDHNLLICTLCKRTFTQPHVLPCLHIFCTPCLEKYVNDVRELCQKEAANEVFRLLLLPENGGKQGNSDSAGKEDGNQAREPGQESQGLLDNPIPVQNYDDILPHNATADFHRNGADIDFHDNSIYEEVNTNSPPQQRPPNSSNQIAAKNENSCGVAQKRDKVAPPSTNQNTASSVSPPRFSYPDTPAPPVPTFVTRTPKHELLGVKSAQGKETTPLHTQNTARAPHYPPPFPTEPPPLPCNPPASRKKAPPASSTGESAQTQTPGTSLVFGNVSNDSGGMEAMVAVETIGLMTEHYVDMSKSQTSLLEAQGNSSSQSGGLNSSMERTRHSSNNSMERDIDSSSYAAGASAIPIYPDVIPNTHQQPVADLNKRKSQLFRNPTICGKASVLPGFLGGFGAAISGSAKGMGAVSPSTSDVNKPATSSLLKQPSMQSVASSASDTYSQNATADNSFVFTQDSTSVTYADAGSVKLPTKSSKDVAKQRKKSIEKLTKKKKKEAKLKEKGSDKELFKVPLLKPVQRQEIVVMTDGASGISEPPVIQSIAAAKRGSTPATCEQIHTDDEDNEYIYEVPINPSRNRSESAPVVPSIPALPPQNRQTRGAGAMEPRKCVPNVYTDEIAMLQNAKANTLRSNQPPQSSSNNSAANTSENQSQLSTSGSKPRVNLNYRPSQRVKTAMIGRQNSSAAAYGKPALRRTKPVSDNDGYEYISDAFNKLKVQTQEGVSDFIYDEVRRLEDESNSSGSSVKNEDSPQRCPRERNRNQSQCSDSSLLSSDTDFCCPQCDSLFSLPKDWKTSKQQFSFLQLLHDLHFQQALKPRTCAQCDAYPVSNRCAACKINICSKCQLKHKCEVLPTVSETSVASPNGTASKRLSLRKSMVFERQVSDFNDQSDSTESSQTKSNSATMKSDSSTSSSDESSSIKSETNPLAIKTCDCEKKPTTVEYFCYTCNGLCCSDCFIAQHRHHACAPMTSLGSRSREYVDQYWAMCDDVSMVYEHETLQLDKHLTQYECTKQKALSDITYAYVRSQQLLEEAYCELSRQVNFRFEEEMGHVRNLMSSNRKFMERIAHARTLAKHVEQFGTQMDLITLTPLLSTNLLSMQASKPQRLESRLSLEFLPASTNRPSDVIKFIGQTQRRFVPVRKRHGGLLPTEMLSSVQAQRERLMHARMPLTMVRLFKARTGTDTRGCKPTGVTIAPNNGHIVVIDDINRKIKVFSEYGRFDRSVDPKGDHALIDPWDITMTNYGNYVVTDKGSKSVKIFDPDGDLVAEFGPHLASPWGVCSSSKGELLVTDTTHKAVFIHDNIGNLKYQIKAPNNMMVFPEYITTNTNDDIIVSDFKCNCIHVFNCAGQYLFRIKSSIPNGKLFENPCGITCDANGHILLADYENARVCEFTASGQFVSYILTKSDHIRAPQCLTTNRRSSQRQLRVILVDGTEIKIYKRATGSRVPSGFFDEEDSVEDIDLELKPKTYNKSGDNLVKKRLVNPGGSKTTESPGGLPDQPPEVPRPRQKIVATSVLLTNPVNVATSAASPGGTGSLSTAPALHDTTTSTLSTKDDSYDVLRKSSFKSAINKSDTIAKRLSFQDTCELVELPTPSSVVEVNLDNQGRELPCQLSSMSDTQSKTEYTSKETSKEVPNIAFESRKVLKPSVPMMKPVFDITSKLSKNPFKAPVPQPRTLMSNTNQSEIVAKEPLQSQSNAKSTPRKFTTVSTDLHNSVPNSPMINTSHSTSKISTKTDKDLSSSSDTPLSSHFDSSRQSTPYRSGRSKPLITKIIQQLGIENEQDSENAATEEGGKRQLVSDDTSGCNPNVIPKRFREPILPTEHNNSVVSTSKSIHSEPIEASKVDKHVGTEPESKTGKLVSDSSNYTTNKAVVLAVTTASKRETLI